MVKVIAGEKRFSRQGRGSHRSKIIIGLAVTGDAGGVRPFGFEREAVLGPTRDEPLDVSGN